LFESLFSLPFQVFPSAVNIKVKHGHCRLEWGCFSSRTFFGRPLKTFGDPFGVAPCEYSFLKVKRNTVLCNLPRPVLFSCHYLFYFILKVFEGNYFSNNFILIDMLIFHFVSNFLSGFFLGGRMIKNNRSTQSSNT